MNLPSVPPGLALDDSVLTTVREAWAKIVGGDDGSFLLFEERAGMGEAEDEDAQDDGSMEKEIQEGDDEEKSQDREVGQPGKDM